MHASRYLDFSAEKFPLFHIINRVGL